MTRLAEETDATKGSAALALSQRATAKVDTYTRCNDPFAERSEVVIGLRHSRSRDADTTPTAAISHAVGQNHLLALPRPNTGRPCLTVRDARRVAACHRCYRAAGESQNVTVCESLLQSNLPNVLDVPWVEGP